MKSITSVTVRLTAWVMALCPLSLAVLCHTGLRSIPLSIESPPQPALAFHQYAVDLRKILPTTEVNGTFVFQNRGTEPVRIDKLVPSCGCLTPRLQGDRDKVIQPGDHGRIIVRMQPANSTAGPHEYTVDVSYSDPQPREVRLTLKLEIPVSTITVSPPALTAYHPHGSAPTIQDFTVTDGRGTPFEITNVSVDSDLIETAIGESGRTQIGYFQQTVRISIAGELPPRRTSALLRIMTDDPDVPELRIPLLLQGQEIRATEEDDRGLDHERAKTVDPVPVDPSSAETRVDAVQK